MKRIFNFCNYSYRLVLLASAVAVIHSVAAVLAAQSERLMLFALAEEFVNNGLFALLMSVIIALIANFAAGGDKTV
jgi:uncharacterized membrane protein